MAQVQKVGTGVTILWKFCHKGKVQKKNSKKKLTNVSFVCVCVAGNGQMLVFVLEFFSPNYSLIDNSLSE